MLPVAQSWALEEKPFLVVSDIDDTLKITNVRSYYDALWNGLWGTSVFLGMKELFDGLKPQGASFLYLSGAPQSTVDRVKDLLIIQKKFPNGPFMLSNWMNWEKSYNFKLRSLIQLSKEVDLPFVLVGDDTEADPEVYSDFMKAVPNRSLKAYIHKVVGRVLPEGTIPYVTAFDIALHEFEAKRITSEQVVEVGKAILNTNQKDQIFPYFKHCPKDFSYKDVPVAQTAEVQKDANLQGLIRSVEEFISKTCI
jgi:phosphatidate phosphatase APP1